MIAKKPQIRNTKGVLYFRGIPNSLKSEFKRACHNKNLSMQDVCEALLRLFVNHPRRVTSFIKEVNNRKTYAKLRKEKEKKKK